MDGSLSRFFAQLGYRFAQVSLSFETQIAVTVRTLSPQSNLFFYLRPPRVVLTPGRPPELPAFLGFGFPAGQLALASTIALCAALRFAFGMTVLEVVFLPRRIATGEYP
jgi:hypothetical protein